jgi:cytochrome c oxidase cbb3-type subunit I
MKLLDDEKDSAVKIWLLSSVVWLAITPFIGFFMSFQFFAPDAMEFLGAFNLSFGKLRAMHTSGVIFAWFGMAAFGSVFYIVPRLCNTLLYSERLANLTAWLWNLVVVLMIVSYWAGIRQPYEYAEAPWFVDILVVIAVLLIIYNIQMTVMRRKRAKLYVSVWYLVGGLYMTAIVYLVGNFLPYLFTGVGTMIINGWWIHNAVGLFITPFGIGIAYYIIPKSAKMPLYSHRLSIIGFWTLVAIYPFTGVHHYLQAPIPTWLAEMAIILSVLLLIPVFAAVTNFLMTPRNNWERLVKSYPLRFATMGTIFYLITSLQGVFQTASIFNWFVHFTEWVPAHAHIAILGAFTLYTISAVYYIIPRVTGRQLWSRSLASWHFWLLAIGIPIFWIIFTISGIVMGYGINLQGNTVYEMIEPLKAIRVARTIAGGFIVLGMWIFAYNIFMTLRKGKPFIEGVSDEVPEVEVK